MSCPQCNGEKIEGYGCPGFKLIELTCQLCKGKGDLSLTQWEWYQQGIKMREQRRSQGRSLREEAKRRRIAPSALSDMEQGRTLPIWEDVPK